MNEITTINCPHCDLVLVANGLPPQQTVRCAGCRATYLLGAVGQPIRTSGKARASLILGIVSVLGSLLAGIPAVILGVLALRDIRKHPATLLGRGMAWAGIISGSVLGLGMTLVVGGALALGVWIARTTESTKDADRIREIAATIGEFELPPDVEPQKAMRLASVSFVDYADVDEQAPVHRRIHLIHYRGWMFRDRQQVRAQAVNLKQLLGGVTVSSSRRWMCRVGSTEVEVTEEVRSDEQGQHFQNFIAALPADSGNVLAIMVVRQARTDLAAEAGARNMAREFLESFQRRQ